MAEVRDARELVLTEAARCVLTDRNQAYGEPEDNFQRIADLWSAYLWGRGLVARGVFLQPADVALLSSYIKDARIMESPERADHWIDRAGYTACGYRCVVGAGLAANAYPERLPSAQNGPE